MFHDENEIILQITEHNKHPWTALKARWRSLPNC